MNTTSFVRQLRRQDGATIVLVAVLLTALIGIAALAIDTAHLVLVRNELQNAADAGALAGALGLYTSDGTAVRPEANQEAYDTAIANRSEKLPVEVNWTSGNAGDVQRGHWSFATRTFTPNDSLAPVELWGVSEDELDANTDFINAVRVVTRRQANPATSFFASIFGYDSFVVSAEAVAYIGFAGPIDAEELDQPIAICDESIRDGTGYTCNIGRMINSGMDPGSSNTAGWTSFYQGDGVCSGTNSNEMRPLICGNGNPDPLWKEPIATTGGTNQVVYDDLRDCWLAWLDPTDPQPWPLKLPVVDCIGHNIGNCPVLVGAVVVNMLWMTEAGTAHPEDSPTEMGDWAWSNASADAGDACWDLAQEIGNPIDPEGPWQGSGSSTYTEGMARWDCFVEHFQLKNADGADAPFEKKSMYFMPDCSPHKPTGGTGGDNFGVLARIPVLVK